MRGCWDALFFYCHPLAFLPPEGQNRRSPVYVLPVKRLVFQSYPNNEIRIGWDEIPYPKPRSQSSGGVRANQEKGRLLDETRETYLQQANITRWRDSNGTLWQTQEVRGEYLCTSVRDTLVITSELQEKLKGDSRVRRADFSQSVGRTRFTRNGRHRLLEAGQICEEYRDRGHVGVFVTFTLPGSTRPAYDALSRYSGYVVNRVCQRIRDDKRAECYFWVWERQKRGALHLHLFVVLAKDAAWDCLRDSLRDTWYSSLQDVSESESVCMFRHENGEFCTASTYWRYDYQEVRKSVGGYLSKYVSKDAENGFTSDPTVGDAGFFPRRWWYISRKLTQEINRRRKTIVAEAIADMDLIEGLDCMSAMAEKCEPVLEHSYRAELGRSKYRDGSFGVSYRKIFWFKKEEFADIELALRGEFIKLIASMQKSRVTFKGFALDYGGERLTPE